MMNIICWLLGHDQAGKTVEKSWNNNADREWRDGWQYYCKRCQDPDNFPLHQRPEVRNLYQRTVLVWIIRRQNYRANIKSGWILDKRGVWIKPLTPEENAAEIRSLTSLLEDPNQTWYYGPAGKGKVSE